MASNIAAVDRVATKEDASLTIKIPSLLLPGSPAILSSSDRSLQNTIAASRHA